MTKVKFAQVRSDRSLIFEIADRAMNELGDARQRDPFSKLDILMDVSATHANGSPLRLRDLLEADSFNFAHDILGIRTHLNRETGKLENCFHPRFSTRFAEAS